MKLSHYFNLVICEKGTRRTSGITSTTGTTGPSPLPLPQREGSEMRDIPCGSEGFMRKTPIN